MAENNNNLLQKINFILFTFIAVGMIYNKFEVKTDKKTVIKNAHSFIEGEYNKELENYKRKVEHTTVVKINPI